MIIGEDMSGAGWRSIPLTLAGIAYCVSNEIENDLQQYCPNWTAAWVPDKELNGNYAYVAYNEKANQYCVAVRGSVLSFSWESFQDWFEQDFDVLFQHAWNYPPGNNVYISAGADKGLTDLQKLTAVADHKSCTMLQFLLHALPEKKASLAVVGHSLGGALATVTASWLHYQIPLAGQKLPLMSVVTFAAPAVGNQNFANSYDAMFGNSSLRYYNSIDIVPMASGSIADMGSLYSPAPEAYNVSVTYDDITVTLQEGILLVAGTVEGVEWWDNSYYTQTNQTKGSVELNTAENLCQVKDNDPAEQWFDQAGCQHSLATYFKYVGGTPIKCTASMA